MVQIYNGILRSLKKGVIMPFAATWIFLEIIILSEVSWKEKGKYYTIIFLWNLKYDINELICETGSQAQRIRLVVS